MFLVIISIVLSFLGLVVGGALGGEFLAIFFGFIGIFGPALFVLERTYKNSVNSSEQNCKFDNDVLESLRVSGILEESRYEYACAKLSEMKEIEENKIKYGIGLDLLYKLSQGGVISQNEFNEKVEELKKLYEQ